MRNDCHPLGSVSPDTAGVIEMMVRIDQILNRFIRHELFDLGHDRRRTLITLRAFDDNKIILHFNQYAVMGTASNVPNSIRRLFGLNRHGIGTYIFRHLDIYWRVCSDSGDRQMQSGQAIMVLYNLGGALSIAEL